MIKTGIWEEAATIIVTALKCDPRVFIAALDGADPEPPLRAWLENLDEAKEAFASASPCTEPQPCACKVFCLLARASQHAGGAQEHFYRDAGASVARYLNAN